MDKKIILFGCGDYGRRSLEYLGEETVYCFVDNNSSLWGSEKYGKKIISFEELKEIASDYELILSVAPITAVQLAKQCESAGICGFSTYWDLFKGKKNPRKPGSKIDWITCVNKAGQWIVDNTCEGAGIINRSEVKDPYPEVSGYYIPTLLRWGYRDLAVSYAKWLCSIQHEDGSWYDTENENPYVFDTAQILKGLIAVRSILPEVDQNIREGCDWLLGRINDEGRMTPAAPVWGEKEGICSELIHLYCITPLRDAGELLGEERYSRAAAKTACYYIENFREEILDFHILSHFYAYIMEALCDLGEWELAREAMDKLAVLQREDGSVPAYRDVDFVCSTGLFQLAVVWYQLGENEKADKALNYGTMLQNESGGWYGSYPVVENAQVTDHRNYPTYLPTAEISWAVKYFLDAVSLKMQKEFDEQADSFLQEIDKTDGRYINLKQEVMGNRNVCDIGCGKGRFAKCLLEDIDEIQIDCVDLSEKVMSYIKADVNKKQGTLTMLPYEDEVFDAVYTVEALEHTLIPENALREMFRVVKPGGKVIVIDKPKDALSKMLIDEWEQYFEDELFQDFARENHCTLNINREFENCDAGLYRMWTLTKGNGKEEC